MNHLKELYRAESLPVFQNRMYSSTASAENCPTGDVVLVQDLRTGLIFNDAFCPELVVYDSDYQNEQSGSTAFRAHLKSVQEMIDRHFEDLTLVEVGCGKGGFLEDLAESGYDIVGMDPAYEGKNPSIRKELFTPSSGITAQGIILRHVLEHIRNPVEFLRAIAAANGYQGRIYIEVPCFDWINANGTWFDVFYEHVNYFRLDDFSRIFGTVFEAVHSFGGQYLSIVADLATIREPVHEGPNFELSPSFGESIGEMAEFIRSHQAKNIPVIIWGGASKGVISTIRMSRLGLVPDGIVDINPAKQGKFIAVTGLQVISPETVKERFGEQAAILVMNGNYLEEIKAATNGRHIYKTI